MFSNSLRFVLALAAGAAAAAAAWFLWPAPKATVRTLVHVPLPTPLVPGYRSGVTITDLSQHQRNQVALLKSRPVFNAALRNKEIADLSIVREQPDPVEWLEREVQADFSAAPDVLCVTLSGDKPDELVTLVDALSEAYLKEIVERETNLRRSRLATLEALRRLYEERLKEARKAQAELVKAKKARDGTKLDDVRENLSHIEELIRKMAAEELALTLELATPRRERVLELAVASHADAGRGRTTAAGLAGLAGALLAFACLSLRVRVSIR